jgi:hypothetical protein
VNLKERFGHQYKIGHDPAATTWGEKADPWMMTIPCRLGTIYLHGGDLLAVEIDGHPKAARQVAAIPAVSCWQDGDDEKTFLFPADRFDEVAAIVQPRRRRQLSAEHQARLVGAGKAALERFRANCGGDKTGPKVHRKSAFDFYPSGS